ncbi:MAG: DUF559 domain-containing protein, partial [Ignavibacteria bacterium]|nr:DUF559 domain-containing protein [Ignavibacteria bacterium]
IRQKIKKILLENRWQIEDAEKIASFDIFSQTASADWFDPEWMFGVHLGFDIVIGNPPYIQLQKDGGRLAKIYEKMKYETFASTGDIYCLFYERGLQLLKEKGLLCFISSNKWMRAGYGEKLRKFFLKYNPLLLVDLGPGIFENATIDTCVFMIQKNTPGPSTKGEKIVEFPTAREEDEKKFPSGRGDKGVLQNFPKWYQLPYNPRLKEKARELRKAGNLAEVLFWNAVKNKKIFGLDFDRQKIIGNYIVDFYCKDLGVVVEIDGKSHNEKIERDQERDNYLANLGLIIYRFAEEEVQTNLESVLNFLKQELQNVAKIRGYDLKEISDEQSKSNLQPISKEEVAQTPSSGEDEEVFDEYESNSALKDESEETRKTEFHLRALTLVREGKELPNISEQVKIKSVVLTNLSTGPWFIGNRAEQQLKEKIERIGVPLKDWDVRIYRGVVTGLNEAFIVTTKKRDEILRNCRDEAERQRTEAIIKPILRGRDIKRYYYEWAGLWIIVIPAGWTNKERKNRSAESFIFEYYPALMEHLKKYEQKAKARYDKGDYWWELRHCDYYPEFEKEKVVWTPVNSEYSFTILPKNFYFNNSIFMITGGIIRYLCAIFNSKLIRKYMEFLFSSEENYTYGSKENMQKVPLPIITTSNYALVEQIENIVNFILLLKKENRNADTGELEREIDHLVYRLYELTEEEIAIVEGKR